MIKYSELTDKEKRALLIDIATTYGKTATAERIAEKYGVKKGIIPNLAGSMRRKGIKVRKARAETILTPEFIQELKNLASS